jgi:hypothetical protein
MRKKQSDQPNILLDPVGDAIVPEGYTLVDTEVEFLRRALSSDRLFIRGESLCRWAERFYQGRHVSFRRVDSPSRTLRNLCPDLSEQHAIALANRLQQDGHIPDPRWKIVDVLARLYPQRLWLDPPSAKHAAEWLCWLEEVQPDEDVQVLLRQQAQMWREQAEEPLKSLYEAYDCERAEQLLKQWFSIEPRRDVPPDLPEFPLPLPKRWRERISEATREWLVEDDEKVIRYLQTNGISGDVKQAVAEQCATYYDKYPDRLDARKYNALQPYLSEQSRKLIESKLPPPEPAPPDALQEPSKVLQWVVEQYLPYRRWCMRYGSREQRQRSEELAGQFIGWLLEFYPRALQDPRSQMHLIFHRVREEVAKHSDTVTLLVVLDGLGWLDALQLHGYISERSSRLKELPPCPVLSALPTITPFAKPAIFKGACPRFALDETNPLADIGEVLPEGNIPDQRLQRAQQGECLVWRVNEPDKTYHERYDSDTISQDVDSELRSLAEKIVKAVHSVPEDIPVRLLITSDHGRLFGESRRVHQPPSGMQAKGRAAWGMVEVPFGGSDYWRDPNSGLVYLHAERYGLQAHLAVPMDTNMFLAEGGKRGEEKFAHGGIHPEEVVVPLLVYLRDMRPPRLLVNATVQGQVGREGKVLVSVSNLEAYPVTVEALRLWMGQELWQELLVQQQVAALSPVETTLVIPTLPAKAQWKQVRATLVVRVREITLETDVALSDQSREMYWKTDLLEELE